MTPATPSRGITTAGKIILPLAFLLLVVAPVLTVLLVSLVGPWLIDVLALLTGNLDRIGGSMWTQEIASHFTLAPFGPPDAPIVNGFSRVRGAPNVMGQFPASCLAEEIAAPGPGAFRGVHPHEPPPASGM